MEKPINHLYNRSLSYHRFILSKWMPITQYKSWDKEDCRNLIYYYREETPEKGLEE